MSDYLTIALLNSAVADKQQIMMLKERIANMEHQYLKLQRECMFSNMTSRNRIRDLESQLAQFEQKAKQDQALNRNGGNGVNMQDNQAVKPPMEAADKGTAPTPNPSGNQVHNLPAGLNAPAQYVCRLRHEIAVFPVPVVYLGPRQGPAEAPTIKQVSVD
ncbi:unnamed protein product [Orchesella dallaii]|uniref:Uncharacterized protein n=1 Tax=Orchesella dallaii TaxID=48710 RepID=A0ABP1QMC7_9HEXA